MAKRSKSEASISAKKFAVYVAAGAATAIATSEDAEAAITYSVIDVLLEDTSETDGFGQGIRLNAGDTSSFTVDFFHSVGTTAVETGFALVGGAIFAKDATDPIGNASIAGFTAGYNYASNLAAGVDLTTLTNWLSGGDNIGTMAFNAGYANEQFTDPGVGFVGFRFDGGSGFTYGWAKVDMTGVPLNSFTVVDFAFASPGESLVVGQVTAVPEPSALAVLATGAVGLAAWRRRKQAA